MTTDHALPRMIRDLLLPRAYPHPVRRIRLIETHISWLLLTGSRAYKIKKPVAFDFLDFHSRRRRSMFCRRELTYNRHYSEGIYLELAPITHDASGFRLAGNGEVVEHAVCMRQFDPDDVLSTRLRQEESDPAWTDTLARRMAQAHASAPCFTETPDATRQLARFMLECLRALEREDPETAFWRAQWQTMFLRQRVALRRRQARGMVRRCHGDLHLGNLVYLDGRVQPFDCIEFNDALSCIDTMNDVAFLFMDCLAHGRADLALRFLSRYLEQSRDYAGLAHLRLFAAYRAAVRYRVARLQDAPGAHYARTMRRMLTRPPQPRLIGIGGYSGSGKSHLALRACVPEQALIVRSDALRLRLHEQHRHLPRYGEEMNEMTRQAVMDAAEHILRAGWSAIVDATFLPAHWRERMRTLARRHRVELRLLWLNTPRARLLQRVRRRAEQGQDISEADEAVLREQWRRYPPPDEADVRHWHDSEHWPWSKGDGTLGGTFHSLSDI